MEFDIEFIRRLCALLREEGLSELTLVDGERRLTLRREVGTAPPPREVHPAGAEATEEGHLIRSPLVGTFWRRPEPQAPPFVEVGDRVEEGQVLCIIESMKVMNEIRSDISGVVREVLVEDGAPVEYGQPLFRIVPD